LKEGAALRGTPKEKRPRRARVQLTARRWRKEENIGGGSILKKWRGGSRRKNKYEILRRVNEGGTEKAHGKKRPELPPKALKLQPTNQRKLGLKPM